jgi:hypothetical protein
MMRLVVGAVIICATFLSCDSSPPAPDDQISTGIVTGSDCANEEDAVVDAVSQTGILEDDVDGDGESDSVFLVEDDEGEPGCKSFIVVRTAGTQYSTAADPTGTPRSMSTPTLNSLAEVNGREGVEIVINVEMGASTQFAALFTFSSGGIEPIELKGKGPGPFASGLGDLFPFGGSVGHLDAVDCTNEGDVVMSAAIPSGDSADAYEVERRFFRVQGSKLVLDKDRTRVEVVDAAGVDEFPEFSGSPFLSCN